MNLGVVDGFSELARSHLRYFFEWLLYFNDDYDFFYPAGSLCTQRIMRELKAIVVASSIHIFTWARALFLR
jgi:hypothetical protein